MMIKIGQGNGVLFSESHSENEDSGVYFLLLLNVIISEFAVWKVKNMLV
jgi:hypothetical protein